MQTIIHLRPLEVEIFTKILAEYPVVEFKESFILNRIKIKESTVTLFSSGKLLIQGPDYLEVYNELIRHLPEQDLAVGIDETGRGEDFGSFVVAGVLADRNDLRQIRDSKKTGDINTAYSIVRNNIIDSHVVVIRSDEIDILRRSGKTMDDIQIEAMREIIIKIGRGREIFIDGKQMKGIKANFIEKGDDLDPVISAASILAKYTRENLEKGKRKTWKTK
ncbi:hypothetical protein ACFLQI_03440 [Candidatus Undinarchaeota archaeon]